MRGTNIKHLYNLKKQGENIFFAECSVCNCFFGTTKQETMTCSELCDKKLEDAREMIRENNFATSGEIILGSSRAAIVNTNFCEAALAEGKKQFTYVLRAKNVYHKFKSIEPLKKFYKNSSILLRAEETAILS